MKRLHVHVNVAHLEPGIRFYSALFGAEPVKVKTDYAKWMLEDPRINFAISTRSSEAGVDHLGIQVDQEEELEEIRARLRQAELSLLDEGKTQCCYAYSDKSWVVDPSGVPWEAYQTMADAHLYGQDGAMTQAAIQAQEPPAAALNSCCASGQCP